MTNPYNLGPLKSHLALKTKLTGFYGKDCFVHIVFLLLNIDRGYSIDPPEPQSGGSSVYPRSTLRANKKTITISHLKIIILQKWKSVYCISKYRSD